MGWLQGGHDGFGRARKCSIMSLLEPHSYALNFPGSAYRECEGKFHGEAYVDFLYYVISAYECSVILIEDGASYHGGTRGQYV